MFLTIILVHFGVVAFLIFGGVPLPDSLVLNFLLSQGILVVPTLIFLLAFERREWRDMTQMPMPGGAQMPGMSVPGVASVYGGAQMPGMSVPGGVSVSGGSSIPGMPRPFEAAGFHKVKISTLLMITLCTFLIMPLVTVLNTLTMFFTDNAVAALEGDIISTPFPAMLFMIGIFGPFCEEFVFRGVIYRSYRRSGEWTNRMRRKTLRDKGLSAVFLSSLLFGLMHMNFNQAVYAFAIGVFLVLLVEAAGSLWASVFCHMFFNSFQVVMMYASESILNNIYGQAVNEAAEQLTTQDLLAALSVYLVIATVTTPIAACVIVWIAKNEGRQEAFGALFRRGGRVPQPNVSRPVPMNVPYPNAQMPPQPMNVPSQMNAQMPPQSMNVPYPNAQMPSQSMNMPHPVTINVSYPNIPQPMNVPRPDIPPQPVQWSAEEPPRADYLLSVPLIIAIVLCLGYMSLELFLL